MIDENVRPVKRSSGGDCGICDDPVNPGEFVILVAFKVGLVITTTTVEKELHVRCAKVVRDALDRRIQEAEAQGGAGGFLRKRR